MIKIHRDILVPFLALLVSSVAACGDGDGRFGMDEQGVYRLDSFTENKDGCSVEGTSALTDQGDHLIVFGGEDSAGYAIHVALCADPADCRKTMQARLSRQGGFTESLLDLEFRKDAGDHFEGGQVNTGFNNGPVCTNAELTSATLGRVNQGRIRLEARTVITDHPADDKGVCWTDGTIKAAMGKPCSRLRLANATRLEPL